MSKKIVIIVILIIAIVLAIAGIWIYRLIYPSSNIEKPKIQKPQIGAVSGGGTGPVIINENFIDYLLVEMGAHKLHNPTFSKNTPKIQIITDQQTFSSEIIKNNIVTKQGKFADEKKTPDLIIRTTNQEIVNAIATGDVLTYVESSVRQGKMQIEQVASRKTLFLKGYLGLYKTITGEELEDEE